MEVTRHEANDARYFGVAGLGVLAAGALIVASQTEDDSDYAAAALLAGGGVTWAVVPELREREVRQTVSVEDQVEVDAIEPCACEPLPGARFVALAQGERREGTTDDQGAATLDLDPADLGMLRVFVKGAAVNLERETASRCRPAG